MMRRLASIGAAGLLFAAVWAAVAAAESTGIERYEADLASSHVTVEGTSTLHDWHAEGRQVGGYIIAQEHELASLWGNSDLPAPQLAPAVYVEIPVTSLTSGNRGMDGKMREALKAIAHPTMIYRLKSARITTRHTPHPSQDSSVSRTIETTGVLTVAGVDQLMDIPMQVRRLSENRLEVSGDTSLRMTEFGIEPPRAMLGTLRTGNTIRVQWTWVLAQGGIENRDVQ